MEYGIWNMENNNMEELQKEVCRKFNSKFSPLDPDTMIALAVDTIGEQPIYASRIKPAESANPIAWFIYCGEYSDDPDFYQAVHIKHLKELLPVVEKYLALETGFNFIIDDRGYEDVWKED